MPGLFQKPSANPLFPDQAQLPQQRPAMPALPGEVPLNFDQWQADPVNLIKIGQDPQQAAQFRTAQQQTRPQPPPDVAPEAPTMMPTAGQAPTLTQPAAPAFDASGMMPKRPEQPQLSKGQNIGMALSTIADSIGAALNHTQATVGPQRLQRQNAITAEQQAYDQNAPKLQYDLKQQVTRDAAGNAATAASTAHTQQVTKNLQGQMSPEQTRKSQFLAQMQSEAESGKYSPDALKAKALRTAQFNGVQVMPEEIDDLIKNTKPLGPAFKVNDEGGYPVSVVRRDGTTLPANSKELTPAEVEAVGGYNSAITDKEKRQDARDTKRDAASDARLNKTLAASLARQNDKPASEGERNAFSFYKRGSDAEKVLTELEPKIASLGLAGQVGRSVLPNVMQSDDNQVYQQAQRQFTQAKLRRESGAAISQAEYDQDAKTYFPSPGDSPAVLKRKAEARQAVLSELKVASGKAYTQTFGDEPQGGGDVVEYERVNGKLVPKAAKK